jgi:hypothetical protein
VQLNVDLLRSLRIFRILFAAALQPNQNSSTDSAAATAATDLSPQNVTLSAFESYANPLFPLIADVISSTAAVLPAATAERLLASATVFPFVSRACVQCSEACANSQPHAVRACIRSGACAPAICAVPNGSDG